LPCAPVVFEEWNVFAPVVQRCFEECGNINFRDAALLFAAHQRPQVQKPIARRRDIGPAPDRVELTVVRAIDV